MGRTTYHNPKYSKCAHLRYLLDVIMISCPLIVKDSGVVDIGTSDYSMVFCILKLKTVKPYPTHIHARSLKHYDPNQFLMELSQLPFDMIFSAEDVEDTSSTQPTVH